MNPQSVSENVRVIVNEKTNSVSVAIGEQRTAVVIATAQGPQGPPGQDSPDSALTRVAGDTVSALRVVYERDGLVRHLDCMDSDNIDFLIGISTTSAQVGGTINVVKGGVIEDSSLYLDLGPIWLGPDGTLVQTPPVDGFDVFLGSAVSANRIVLNIQEPINLMR